MTVSIAPKPSIATTPRNTDDYKLILDYLSDRFPKVSRANWAARMHTGKVTDSSGRPIPEDSPCLPNTRILYYREVTNELRVPFEENIVFQNDHIIIADKPHFLPTIPSGPYVTECLLYRLRRRLNNEHLVPINRLDRETAGLVMFSSEPRTRGRLARLFAQRRIKKSYIAVSIAHTAPHTKEWLVETRIEKSTPWFLRCNTSGPPNSCTRIRALKTRGEHTLFHLEPVTGRQHQLRLHMCHIGFPILNDPFYPQLQDERKDGFDNPLQLLAHQLSFEDPITREPITATSRMTLTSWNQQEALAL